MSPRIPLIIAGILGFAAVVAGTFAAHGLEGRISAEDLRTWEVAVRYQMFHALAILALAGFAGRLGGARQVAVWCWAFGCVVFAGSLYALVLSGHRWLGAVTPIGGVAFLVGWVCVVIAGVRQR